MKTIEEYINEKQNFIFGGKLGLTGKEYNIAAPNFFDLKRGDKLYWYEWELREGVAKFDNGIEAVVDEVKREKYGKYYIDGNGFRISDLSEKQMKMSYYAYKTVFKRGVYINAVTTYEVDESDLNELFDNAYAYIKKFKK